MFKLSTNVYDACDVINILNTKRKRKRKPESPEILKKTRAKCKTKPSTKDEALQSDPISGCKVKKKAISVTNRSSTSLKTNTRPVKTTVLTLLMDKHNYIPGQRTEVIDGIQYMYDGTTFNVCDPLYDASCSDYHLPVNQDARAYEVGLIALYLTNNMLLTIRIYKNLNCRKLVTTI